MNKFKFSPDQIWALFIHFYSFILLLDHNDWPLICPFCFFFYEGETSETQLIIEWNITEMNFTWTLKEQHLSSAIFLQATSARTEQTNRWEGSIWMTWRQTGLVPEVFTNLPFNLLNLVWVTVCVFSTHTRTQTQTLRPFLLHVKASRKGLLQHESRLGSTGSQALWWFLHLYEACWLWASSALSKLQKCQCD